MGFREGHQGRETTYEAVNYKMSDKGGGIK